MKKKQTLATQSLVVKRQSRLKYRIWDASNTNEEGESKGT